MQYEDKTILSMHVSNNIPSKHIKQRLTDNEKKKYSESHGWRV